MKFKTSFARIVNEAQLVEAIIEADSEEQARDKFSAGEFHRFLILKRDAREVTNVGDPSFDRLS